jgi:predicted DNA-binding transcriptional regulator AlpA
MNTFETNERLLSLRFVCQRYNVADRTIDRWLESKILPEPIRINRLRYWRLSDLERFERERLNAKPAERDSAAA